MSDDPKNNQQSHDDTVVTPLDPTDDFAEMVGDTSGLTGISNDTNSAMPPQNSGTNPRDVSDYRYKTNLGRDVQDDLDKPAAKTDQLNSDNDGGFVNDDTQPEETGEQSVSGDMPSPDSDDDTLENAHKVGIALDEDSEHPQELNIAADIDRAEEYQHTH